MEIRIKYIKKPKKRLNLAHKRIKVQNTNFTEGGEDIFFLVMFLGVGIILTESY